MRSLRVISLVAVIVGVLSLTTVHAWADTYAGQPGQVPKVGAVDNGFHSADNGTQVLGRQFTRTGSGDEFLPFSGVEIAQMTLLGLALIALGLVLVRRRGASGPTQPA
jgi:hypothetical protein